MKFYKMKKILLFFFIFPLFVTAQDKTPVAEGISPNLYINHTVASKENFYSIGRIYNASPKDIAPFNKLPLESGLSLGQQLKVPLNAVNFFQNGTAEADETFVPVYYAVKDKEGLSGIPQEVYRYRNVRRQDRLCSDRPTGKEHRYREHLVVRYFCSPGAARDSNSDMRTIRPFRFLQRSRHSGHTDLLLRPVRECGTGESCSHKRAHGITDNIKDRLSRPFVETVEKPSGFFRQKVCSLQAASSAGLFNRRSVSLFRINAADFVRQLAAQAHGGKTQCRTDKGAE